MVATVEASRRGTGLLAAVGGVWLAVAIAAAWAGLVVRDPDEPPLRIGLAAGLPVVIVGLALLAPRFRAWVEGLDLGVLIAMQGWRVAGFAFLAVYAQDLLPASFALPAGLGDLVVGLAAPFVAAAVAHRARGAGPLFVGFTVFGIADFVMAVSLGIANGIGARVLLPDGSLDTPPMAELPLSLVPTFAVPFLLVVHVLSLVRFNAEQRHAVPR